MTFELDTVAAAIVVDHPFVPRGEWYERCGYSYGPVSWGVDRKRARLCGLAEAAHASTTLNHEPGTVIDHEGTT